MSEIKRLRKMADKIYAKMENMQRLTDSELKGKTDEFKLRLKNGETVDQIMPDAYAAVGEAAYRSIGLRPYKVQIIFMCMTRVQDLILSTVAFAMSEPL